MTFKYIYTYEYLDGYSFLYQYCHIPIDNILINNLKEYNPPIMSSACSRINDYNEYIKYQQWFHSSFNKISLDVEFKIWGRKKL